MSEAPRHPLRDALAPADDGAPLDWITGVVQSITTSSNPHTVTVRLANGTLTQQINHLGWWVPRVNDLVHLLRKGPALLVLGPVAPALTRTSPHRHDAADIDGTVIVAPPTPTTPPPPPPAAPTIRTVGIAPLDAAYWSSWGWKTDDLIQGGPANRAFLFYGGQIAAARGAGTIVAASVYLERRNTSHGVGGQANVRLGTHEHQGRPGDGGAPHAAVSVAATLGRGEGANIPLSAEQIANLNGPHHGLGLEPGASGYSSPDYLRALLGGASGQLSLTIQT